MWFFEETYEKKSSSSSRSSSFFFFTVVLLVWIAFSGCFLLRKLDLMWHKMTHQLMSSYVAQYPVPSPQKRFTLYFPGRSFQSNIISTSLGSMREGCSYTYPPLSTARYSSIQMSELKHCRVQTNCPCPMSHTAAQDLNPGSLSRESEALPRSHCALYCSSRQHWRQCSVTYWTWVTIDFLHTQHAIHVY